MLYFLCGALSSFSSDMLMHPADTIKARLQVQTKSVGFLKEFNSLVSKEGFRGLYKGYLSVFCCGIPGNALFYFTYETLKKQNFLENSPNSKHLLAAGIANIVATSIYCPMEVIKQQTMVQSGLGTHKVFFNIWNKKGVAGFYEGAPSAILTWTPYFSIYFLIYERCSHYFQRRSGTDRASLKLNFQLTSAVIAGIVASSLTNPMDVVKTRFQSSGEGIASGLKYKSIAHAFKTIYTHEGHTGFLRGLQGRVLWLTPASSLTIVFYENYLSFFSKRFPAL
uniref:Mitochondrial carrier protein n=1 Tax=Arcella intermedia TaxID=1963864 RepID=A0A6B2LDS2_9EUKA